jgi:hypothetical protein
MATAWIYVINTGSGTPNVVRKSHTATTVVQEQPGVYLVTFPPGVRGLACVATLNNSVGTITAVPGDSAGLPANQVSVATLTLQNRFLGSLDFSLAVFYNPGHADVVDTSGLLMARTARRAGRGPAKRTPKRR